MTKKSRAMELYRFISAVLILCYHCYWFAFRDEGTEFIGFYLFVELFFILSGFLMVCSVRRHVTQEQMSDPAGATVKYMKGRLRQLYPHHLLSWALVACILLFLTKDMRPAELLYVGLPEIFLVNIFGFVRGEYINIVCWYLSATVFASAIIYYLLVKNENGFVKIIAPLIIVFCYGTLFDRKESLAATIIFARYSPFMGFMRGFADMSVGCIAYRVYEYLADTELPGESLWATILEGSIFLAGGVWMFKNSGKADFLFVPLFFLFVISVFRGKSLFSRLFDNRFSAWLGKQSYAYFLNNLVVIYPCMYFFPDMNLRVMCLVCIPACFVVSLVTGYFLKAVMK